MGGSESVRFSGMMDDNIDKRLVRGGRRTGFKKRLNRGGKVDVNRNDGISNGEDNTSEEWVRSWLWQPLFIT